jgi:hypothetical protein
MTSKIVKLRNMCFLAIFTLAQRLRAALDLTCRRWIDSDAINGRCVTQKDAIHDKAEGVRR